MDAYFSCSFDTGALATGLGWFKAMKEDYDPANTEVTFLHRGCGSVLFPPDEN